MEEAMRYHNDYGECVHCHMLWREKLDGRRLEAGGAGGLCGRPARDPGSLLLRSG
jgi:hypothetical protein